MCPLGGGGSLLCSLGCLVGSGSASGFPLTAPGCIGEVPITSLAQTGGLMGGALGGLWGIVIPLPPPFRGFQRGLGGCVSSFPLGGGGVGTVSLSVSVFSLIYLPFPPILGSGDKDNSPSHSGNLAGYPFSHSLWSTQEHSPFLHKTCPASPPVLGGFVGQCSLSPHFWGWCNRGLLLPFQFWGVHGASPCLPG